MKTYMITYNTGVTGYECMENTSLNVTDVLRKSQFDVLLLSSWVMQLISQTQ